MTATARTGDVTPMSGPRTDSGRMANHADGTSVWPDLVQPGRVRRDVYVSSYLHTQENERVFSRVWVFVGLESEVPEPGSCKPIEVGGQPVVMVRDKAGVVRVFYNRCRHRGSLVCREESAAQAALRCPYHGWTYSLAGDLVGVPFPSGYGPSFDKGNLALKSPPHVESYRGLVFLNHSTCEETLSDYLGPAKEYLDLIIDASPEGSLVAGHGAERYVMNANWKLQAENVLDGYHPTFVHKTAFEILERRLGRNPALRIREGSDARAISLPRGHGVLDYTGAARDYSGRRTASSEYRMRLVESLGLERAEEVLAADIQLFVFPNLFIHSERQHYRVIRSVGVDRTEVTAYPYALAGAPTSLNEKNVAALTWWASPAGFGQPDDIEMLERCQAGLTVRADDWVLHNRGMDREVRNSNGVVSGDISDEVPQRGFYRAWHELMKSPFPEL